MAKRILTLIIALCLIFSFVSCEKLFGGLNNNPQGTPGEIPEDGDEENPEGEEGDPDKTPEGEEGDPDKTPEGEEGDPDKTPEGDKEEDEEIEMPPINV